MKRGADLELISAVALGGSQKEAMLQYEAALKLHGTWKVYRVLLNSLGEHMIRFSSTSILLLQEGVRMQQLVKGLCMSSKIRRKK
jgi:hypothetical protein